MSHPWFNEQAERRIQEWTQEQERLRQREREENPPPMVAIGGDHGAFREHVARGVARTLEFTYWDREILHELSREGRIPESLLERLDEHRMDQWGESFAGFRLQSSPRSSDYARLLRDFVSDLRDSGRAVIVGRGVRFLVGPERAFRVHVTAPKAFRARTLMAVRHLDEDEALRRLAEVDAERTEFARSLLDADPDDLGTVDLTVNTGTLGLQGAVQTVVDAYRRRFPEVGADPTSP